MQSEARTAYLPSANTVRILRRTVNVEWRQWSMAFKMVCPKCGSLNYSVERDGRSYIRTGPSSELIFSCRCGKQLFGDALTEEFERQRSAYESQAADRQRAERDREAAVIAEREKDEKLRQAMEYQRNYQREKREQEAESARAAKEEADAAWRAKVSAPGGATDGEDGELLPPGTPPDKAAHLCGWGPCVNDARPKSKYCSRGCSNKNARWRHKRRKKDA